MPSTEPPNALLQIITSYRRRRRSQPPLGPRVSCIFVFQASTDRKRESSKCCRITENLDVIMCLAERKRAGRQIRRAPASLSGKTGCVRGCAEKNHNYLFL